MGVLQGSEVPVEIQNCQVSDCDDLIRYQSELWGNRISSENGIYERTCDKIDACEAIATCIFKMEETNA